MVCGWGVRVHEEARGFQDEAAVEHALRGLASGLLARAGDGAGAIADSAGVLGHVVAVGEFAFDRIAERDVRLRKRGVVDSRPGSALAGDGVRRCSHRAFSGGR